VIDFVFPGYETFFKEMWADSPEDNGGWQGGIALKRGVFRHFKDLGSQGRGGARWYYH
jgi:hypothetical protein